MELLVIKAGTDYIRIKEGTYAAVGLNQASVFPLEQLEQVQHHLICVQKNGFPRAAVYRLLLTEMPL